MARAHSFDPVLALEAIRKIAEAGHIEDATTICMLLLDKSIAKQMIVLARSNGYSYEALRTATDDAIRATLLRSDT